MITVAVVDDDHHVARAHRLSVERVAGCTVVGEAHTGAEAVALVDSSAPDLLLLDVYLPDFDGLEVVRRLMASSDHLPDFLLVTAARDIDSVRTAMQLGAFRYLVKPFTFIALREQLETYRAWFDRLGQREEADQQAVDDLFSLRAKQSRSRAPTRPLQPTMAKVLDIVSKAPEPVGAAEVASVLGASRPTAQRYLAALLRRDLVRLDLSSGRPEHRYRI